MEGQANNHGLQGFSVKRVIYLPRGYQGQILCTFLCTDQSQYCQKW